MRILVLNYEYPPLGGGAGVATAALAQGLVERGVDVDVVTASAGPDAESRTTTRNTPGEHTGGLTLYRVKSRRTGIHQAGMRDAASYLLAALPVIRRLLRTHTYDVVHFFFSLPTGALLPFLQLGRTPVVVSLRGSDVPGYDPHNPLVQSVHRLLLPLTWWIWRRAHRVVALSAALGRLALRADAKLEYTVVHNGVDLARFHPPATPRPVRVDRVRCLAVARLVERKGLRDLLTALSMLERGRFHLEIVGSGPDERLLRELVARLGLQDEVTFTGSLDREAVAERYREADLFTLASWEESFGNVFAEALASGLPIVGSTTGGIPEFIEHGSNGLLVKPGDICALAGAIRSLADDPQLRRDIGQRNRAKAEATLGWSEVTKQYLSIYHAIRLPVPAGSLVAAATPTTS